MVRLIYRSPLSLNPSRRARIHYAFSIPPDDGGRICALQRAVIRRENGPFLRFLPAAGAQCDRMNYRILRDVRASQNVTATRYFVCSWSLKTIVLCFQKIKTDKLKNGSYAIRDETVRAYARAPAPCNSLGRPAQQVVEANAAWPTGIVITIRQQ